MQSEGSSCIDIMDTKNTSLGIVYKICILTRYMSINSSVWCGVMYILQHIMSEPEEITTMSGQKLQLKMSVDYISFSAHTDYQQTSEFIRALKPPHVVGD